MERTVHVCIYQEHFVKKSGPSCRFDSRIQSRSLQMDLPNLIDSLGSACQNFELRPRHEKSYMSLGFCPICGISARGESHRPFRWRTFFIKKNPTCLARSCSASYFPKNIFLLMPRRGTRIWQICLIFYCSYLWEWLWAYHAPPCNSGVGIFQMPTEVESLAPGGLLNQHMPGKHLLLLLLSPFAAQT